MQIFGIDFGNKTAGTTVICTLDAQDEVHFAASQKKQDADAFLLDYFAKVEPGAIYLDAPLSLPAGFSDPKPGADFFYRRGDRETRAMSPMFLGGLTARAIRLRTHLEALNHQVWETYPGQLARLWELPEVGYKKGPMDRALELVRQRIPFCPSEAKMPNWHHFDALLALSSGWRHRRGIAVEYGDAAEGSIIV